MDATGQDQAVPFGSLRDRPNQITAARLGVTVACFACLSLGWFTAGLIAFGLAAATDWLDGYWARRWGPITKLGRVLDPLADKLLICGVFVYLAAIPGSGIAAWMAVVVLARELLVTALRGAIEAAGGDFSAKWLGKQKMVWQCAAAVGVLLRVSGWGADWLGVGAGRLVDGLVWLSLLFTVWSGVDYAVAAARASASGRA